MLASSLPIKQWATQLGFTQCGITQAVPLHDDARKLEQWLHKGMHGSMSYMERYFEQRINPSLLVPDAKSVITLLFNYYPAAPHNTNGPKISSYAYGADYHTVIKQKLHTLLNNMQQHYGAIAGRGFVDSAPVLERSWAVRSGLGWVGKNGNLINKQQGSFFFIATIITDLVLPSDAPYSKDYCGTCTACIDACPTQAILPNKVVDGSKCISHYTIELKAAAIPTNAGNFDNWIFGCDTCQDVCPWNRFSVPHQEPLFTPITQIMNFNISEWLAMNETEFKKIFKHSPLSRAKYSGILRNLQFYNSQINGT
jgi:epoxyqueuosine reductase